MPTAHRRIQVTVDDELAEALDAIDPAPASRSKLVRDLALTGAHAVRASRAREAEALQVLLEIADGGRDYDFAAAAAMVESRASRLP